MKLSYSKTFAIGLGFFTVNLVWAIYNVAVPLYLDNLGLSGTSVGIVMTIDNIFALLFLPIFGALSDRTQTRYGKRMPYLLVGIPLSAIAFFVIPFSIKSLAFLMTSVIALNFFMSVYRAPTVALMPDVTPRPLRSKANGIINFMGGLGSVVAFFLSGILFNIAEFVPYASVSVIMIITIILMFNIVKEPETISNEKEENSDYEASASDSSERGKLLSLIFLLLAIFFWYTGFNAVETFFSTYGQKILGIDKSDSSFLLAIFSALFLISCIPAGLIAGKLGRKKTIMAGIIILLSAFVSMIFIKTISVIYVIMGLGGIGWALININSYPMVVEMTSNRGIGKYTGYYYFFSMMSAIVSPILYGFLKDILGDGFMFIYSSIATIAALFFMMLVKHGEARQQPVKAFESLEYMET
ncbi:MAG TPA: SLC45 family MFS transporter [Clostridiaceae bacterium]|nr:SLC45 family MFS transporter [Clostridiaceae bacterium]